MDTVFNYLFEANIILILLFGVFWWVASHETFHKLNRVVLLGIILCSFSLPLLNFPTYEVVVPEWLNFGYTSSENSALTPETSPETGVTVFSAEALNEDTSSGGFVSFITNINPWLVLLGIYLIISLVFLLKIIRQLYSLYMLMDNGQHYWDEGIIQVHLKDKVSPFSFFHWVFFNPDQIQNEQRRMILEHERIHATQFHNIDILLGELCVVLFWFNPIVWKLKQAINQNLEFIADEEMIRNGTDRKNYQYCLLSLHAPLSRIPVANHFNYSLIKNRIHMMNIKKSSDNRLVRYMLFIPLILCFLLISNLSYAQAEKKAKPKSEIKAKEEPKSKLKARPKTATSTIRTTRPEAAPKDSVVVRGILSKAVSETEPVVVGTEVQTITAVETDPEVVAVENVTITGRATGIGTSSGQGTAKGYGTVKAIGKTSSAQNVEGVVVEGYRATQSVGEGNAYFNIPVKEDEDVFMVIRSNISQKTLNEVPGILKKHGIDATFDQVEFDGNGNLTRIHVKVKVGDRYHGSMKGYNNGRPIDEPIVVYVMKSSSEKFGITKGMTEEIPSKVRNSLDRLTGLLIIQGSENYIKGRYELRKAH